MAAEEPPCQSPSRSKASTSIFKDISNFKTPKRPTQTPKFTSPSTQFFTASKQTPRTSSSFRRRPSLAPPSATNSKTVRKLRTLEVEQLQSSRKAQIKKERSLKSLSKSITVWLNFLFQSPGSCGVDLSIVGGNGDRIEVSEKGKRDSFPGIGVRVDAAWRNPKRQRDSTWRAVVAEDAENVVGFSNSKYSNLESSLKYICSFEDLKQRMSVYLSLGSCKEVFDVMTQLVKNIDEGRLKMKAHCPLVTDVGLKQKATRILMCYNPIWLRIGLYIIFGGDSLLSDGDVSSDEEIAFLRIFIEKQFFSHAGLAKAYAYNKMVEGLYRPGYYETLGNVILKRFLLLVLILDRAKCQSSLSLKYGIDGVDGGSPLLFTVKSRIKSSSQVILEFLSSEIMLGEGNVLAHLVIVGYKVSYQQNPLVEYNFQVTDLFVDFQDGVRLCRATQLLLNDSSILMKIIVPSDTRKKSLANCSIVLQYLKQAGMPLCDDEGMMIEGEDVSNGDKELTLSLLWNMFVHLQLPLLMKKTMLVEEICKIRELNVDLLNTTNSTPLEMLFSWIQAICQNYNCKIDNLSSLVDGKAIWCLLDYYFRKELCCSYSSKNSCRSSSEESIVLATDYADAVHNFLLSQKLTTLLGNFPEVLQISDILEYNGPCNDRSVVILLVFLASQLIVRKNMDQLNFHKLLGCDCQNPVRKYTSAEQCFVSPEVVQIEDETHGQSTEDAAKKFKAIQAWWRDMTEKNYPSVAKPAATIVQQVLTDNDNIKVRRESAAKVIQSHFRQAIERRNSQRMLLVQHSAAIKIQSDFRMSRCLKAYNQYKVLLVKHNAATKIQSHFRCWIVRRRFQIQKEAILKIQSDFRMSRCLRAYNQLKVLHIQNFATTKIQSHLRCWILRRRYHDQREAILKIQSHFRMSRCLKAYNQRKVLLVKHSAATKIQSHFRCWILRRRYQDQREAILKIQSHFRMSRCLKAYNQRKVLLVKHSAATKIQSHFRCWILRRRYQDQREAILKIQSHFRMSRCLKAYNQRKVLLVRHSAATKIQSHFRCWMLRRRYQDQREAILKIQSHFRMSRCLKAYNQRKVLLVRHSAATKIQSHFRCWMLRRRYQDQREAILKIQSHFRMSRCLKAYNQRKVLLVRHSAATKIQSHFRCWMLRRRYQDQREAILKIQSHFRMSRCLKAYNQRKVLLVRHSAATKIQSHFRCWMLKRRFQIQKEAILKIQSGFRMSRCLKAHQQYKILTMSATIIQSCVRGWICRREVCRRMHLIVLIQRLCRGWLIRRDFMSQKKAVVKIQAAVRGLRCLKVFHRQRQAAVDIQRFVRAQKTKKLLGASSLHAGIPIDTTLQELPIDTTFQVFGSCCQHSELNSTFSSVLKLQRWWRGALSLKRRTRSALTIQSHFRGWIARRKATRERHCIVLIQSYWKGYQARKESRGQLLDLRLRVKESARNVDDNMRIINRLIAALSELLSKKSVSSILHTCATLDMATRYSQKCCEKLVEARAINTLLKLIQSVSRSIPDQEVLKHALSTLRNLARYPHLVEVLIDCHGSVETILREMIRNKEEVYFIASELLKKICASRKGIEAVRKSPALLKRLHNLVEELTRKAHNEKRNARGPNSREYTERRLREASEILKVVVM